MSRIPAVVSAPGLPSVRSPRHPWVLPVVIVLLAMALILPTRAVQAQIRVISVLPGFSDAVGELSILVDFGRQAVDDPSQIVVTLDGVGVDVLEVVDPTPGAASALREVRIGIPEDLPAGTHRLSVALAPAGGTTGGEGGPSLQPFSVLDVTLGTQRCPEGQFVVGFNANGGLICAPLTTGGGGGGSSDCEMQCEQEFTACTVEVSVRTLTCQAIEARCIQAGGTTDECEAVFQACLADPPLPNCEAERNACLELCPVSEP